MRGDVDRRGLLAAVLGQQGGRKLREWLVSRTPPLQGHTSKLRRGCGLANHGLTTTEPSPAAWTAEHTAKKLTASSSEN